MSKKHKSKKYARKHKPEPHGVSVSYEVGPAVMHRLYELIGHGFRAGLDYLRAMAAEERQAENERRAADDAHLQTENDLLRSGMVGVNAAVTEMAETARAQSEQIDMLNGRIDTLVERFAEERGKSRDHTT